MSKKYKILNINKKNRVNVLASLLCLEFAIFTIGSSLGLDMSSSAKKPDFPQKPLIPGCESLEVEFNSGQRIDNWIGANRLTYTLLVNQISETPQYKKEYKLLTSRTSSDKERIESYLSGKIKFSRETLYVGDSRTQGLLYSGATSEENTVYGVGYGYRWLTGNGTFSSNKTNAINGAIAGIEEKMEPGKSYNIVIWLGVNDLKYVSASTYFEKYSELATGDWKKHDIYIASVGPVMDSRAENVKNKNIDAFNASLKELVEGSDLRNLHYIDLALTPSTIIGYDGAGLHYSSADSQNIQSLMISEVERVNLERQEEMIELYTNITDIIDQTKNEVIKARFMSLKPKNIKY